MIFFLQFIFFASLFFLLHSYLFYPLHLHILNWLHKPLEVDNSIRETNALPAVSVIVSVFNEEGIVDQKIQSLVASDYPTDKLSIYLGSDASTDRTNEIIRKWSASDPRIQSSFFSDRRGKALVINDLVDLAFEKEPRSANHILLFTDANVLLAPGCMKLLCRHFARPEVALVDSKILPVGLKADGISASENEYMNFEIRIKYLEGKLWGTMMGAFGGCFAVRSTFLEKVPARFLVDDFYISMCTLNKGGFCLNDLEAICFEGKPDLLKEEFRRKARISAGNFQNLAIFYKTLFRPPFRLAYAFLSHKVLRWLGPFFLILMILATVGLTILDASRFYVWAVVLIGFMGVVPVLDFLTKRMGIHLKLLRGIRYFFAMNLALLFGFINYLRGIRQSSWDPPKRSMN